MPQVGDPVVRGAEAAERRLRVPGIFVVEHSPEGGFLARALGESIHTQAESVEQLHARVRDAVQCHFDAGQAPKMIRLHFVRDEVIPA